MEQPLTISDMWKPVIEAGESIDNRILLKLIQGRESSALDLVTEYLKKDPDRVDQLFFTLEEEATRKMEEKKRNQTLAMSPEKEILQDLHLELRQIILKLLPHRETVAHSK